MTWDSLVCVMFQKRLGLAGEVRRGGALHKKVITAPIVKWLLHPDREVVTTPHREVVTAPGSGSGYYTRIGKWLLHPMPHGYAPGCEARLRRAGRPL